VSGFAEEFGPEYAVEAEIVEWFEANGWDDSSWHNNICPSFGLEYPGTRGDLLFEVFVDALDPEEREAGPGPRFSVHIFDEDGERESGPDFDTFEEVRGYIADQMAMQKPPKSHREKLDSVRATLAILSPRLTEEYRGMLRVCDRYLVDVRDSLPEDDK